MLSHHCCCQPSQVPLHVGTAFSTAAQRSWKSFNTAAALAALQLLLSTAAASGLISNGAAAGSLGSSMRQQLQQTAAMQQLAAVMTALAAEMRSGAVAMVRMSEVELCANLRQFSVTSGSVSHLLWMFLTPVHTRLKEVWRSPTQTADDSTDQWLCDDSRQAEAAFELCTAALQYISSVLQHLLPAVQRRGHPKAADLKLEQEARLADTLDTAIKTLSAMSCSLYDGLPKATAAYRQRLQQLLLSPQFLPLVASVLVLTLPMVNTADSTLDSKGTNGSSSSSNSSGGGSNGGGSRPLLPPRGRQQGRQKQGRNNTSSSGAGSSSKAGGSAARTPCQLQLLQLLGIRPELAALAKRMPSFKPLEMHVEIPALMIVVGAYRNAVNDLSSLPPRLQGDIGREQQRWRFEQQLWLLLPSVLLPCANSLLVQSSAHGRSTDFAQQQGVLVLAELLQHSSLALGTPCWLGRLCGGGDADSKPPHPSWMGEVLGGVLELGDRLLVQQQQQTQTEPPAAAAPNSLPLDGIGSVAMAYAALNSLQMGEFGPAEAAAAAEQLLSGTSSSHVMQAAIARERATCAVVLTNMLSLLVKRSYLGLLSSSSSPSSSSTANDAAAAAVGAAAAAAASPCAPVVAKRFGEVCTTLEAGLRAATAATQSGTIKQHPGLVDSCLDWLLLEYQDLRPTLMLHMGLRGDAALVLEQRQLYSLLSTVQKLGSCKGGDGEVCWGKQVDTCWWAVGQAAVRLLQVAGPVTGLGAAAPAGPAAASAAAAPAAPVSPPAAPGPRPAAGQQNAATSDAAKQQLAEAEYLPSLVLFGRCCLAWAEQLQQQAPVLLSGGRQAGTASRQQGQGVVKSEFGAAYVCIPGSRFVFGAGVRPADKPCELERFTDTVSSWVGGVTSPVARSALAAAAGGDLQQLRQQLGALSAAQAAVREGVSEASMAALVQQLQATGEMLSGIAVPHFCNYPACGNISGPTEVRLVSGRSCICGGCRIARYCGRACQRAAWKQHRPVCKLVAAAAANAGDQV